MGKFEKASHQVVIDDVKENIEYLEKKLLPRLKKEKIKQENCKKETDEIPCLKYDDSIFSLAEFKKACAVFYNAGASINYLISVANDYRSNEKTRDEAKILSERYDKLCEQSFVLMEELTQEEQEEEVVYIEVIKRVGKWLHNYEREILPTLKNIEVWSPRMIDSLCDQARELDLIILRFSKLIDKDNRDLDLLKRLENARKNIDTFLNDYDSFCDEAFDYMED